jgi:hypothetical protein
MEEIRKSIDPKLNQRSLQEEKENLLEKQVKRVCTPQENKRKREQSTFQQQPLKKVRIEEHVMIDEMDTPIEEEEEEELNHQFIQFLHEPKSLADRMCLFTSMIEQFHFFDFISKKLKNLTNFNFLKNEISANKIRLEYVNESDFIRIFSVKYSQYSLEKPIHLYISNLIYNQIRDPKVKNGGDLLKKALIVFYQEWKEERSIFSGFIHDLLLEDDELFEEFCLKIQQNLENGKISQMMKQIGVFFKLHEGNASDQLNNFLKLGFKSPFIDAL